MIRKRWKIGTAVVLAGVALSAHAQMKPEDSIRYRQGIFTAQRWNMIAMFQMVQGRIPYDRDKFLLHAQRIEQLSKMAWEGFGPDTDKGAPTRAKPEVWTNNAQFRQAAEAFQAEAPKLVAAAQSGNMDQIKAAFNAVNKACDNCHDNFRAK